MEHIAQQLTLCFAALHVEETFAIKDKFFHIWPSPDRVPSYAPKDFCKLLISR